MNMSCNIGVDNFQAVDAELDVEGKYISLMQTTLAPDSLYTRAKETIQVLFENLNITEPERAKLTVEYVANMSTQLSNSAMQTALGWAKAEKDGEYQLALVKAQTEKALAEKEVAKESICKMMKDTELVCANITATVAGSIRDNGTVTSYDPDNECIPKTLGDNGLKYEQTQQVKAASYQSFADAFRKSGVVQIGIDSDDSVKKGLSGDEDGYTWQQSLNAERQRIAYEDSKRNHAANSAASMIGQLLSSETFSDSNAQDVQRWRDAVDFLNNSHSSTNQV